MKKIYIAIAAVLLAAASVATFLSIRSHNRMDDFFRANVEVSFLLAQCSDYAPETVARIQGMVKYR